MGQTPPHPVPAGGCQQYWRVCRSHGEEGTARHWNVTSAGELILIFSLVSISAVMGHLAVAPAASRSLCSGTGAGAGSPEGC